MDRHNSVARIARWPCFRQAYARSPNLNNDEKNDYSVLNHRLPPLRHRLLVLAIGLAMHQLVLADEGAPSCPVGVIKCPKKADDFASCKRNALLDFYTPGLPTSADRASAVTDFSSHTVQSSDKAHYVLEGQVEAKRADELLQADKLTYDTETSDYTATGHVRYQDRDILISADNAHGTATPESTYLSTVHYQLLQQRGNGTAADATLIDADHGLLHQGTYSTCDPDQREWEIRARELSIDQARNEGKAHGVVLSYHDVSLFYFPYFSFPLNNERESGFLYPSFGYNSRRGFDFSMPYYLNLAPNYDATLYPRLMSERGFMLGGEFRYLTPQNKGQLEFTYLPHDQDAHHDRGSFRYQDWSVISPNWNAVVNLNHVSDDRYFEDFGDSLTSTATSLLPSSAYINGRGEWWNASFGADAWQITDPTLSDSFEPYRRLPRATFEAEHATIGALNAGVKSEYVAFHKDDALDGQRLDVYPYLAYPIETSAYFVRPELGLRYTSYDLDRSGDSSPSRSVPIASLDAGLFFDRTTELFHTPYIQTLEPRFYYVRVPFRDQTGLPVFDTQEPTFDFGQLFRTNRFVGADRQMDANNVTVALQSRLLDEATGQERLALSFGEIRYFDPQKVQLPGAPVTDFAGSDYVGEVDWRLNDRWRITLADQWNPNTHQTDLSAVGLEHRFGGDGILNLSYRYRRDFLEQVDAAALYPISERWRLIGRYNYSLKDHKVLESFGGAEYDTCCVALRILGRHYVRNVEGNSSNALYFEFEFKGLGALGQKTENFLRRAILGYQ